MKPRWAGTLQKDIDELAKGLRTLLVDSFIVRVGSAKFPSPASDEGGRR
jgi:hypothetical protein